MLIKKSREYLLVDIKAIFEQFRSLVKTDAFKKKIEKPALDFSGVRSDSLLEDLIQKIAERRDQELERIERMIR